MERVCRVCGREYKGLVCRWCHPRGSRKRALAAEAAQMDAERQVGSDAGAGADVVAVGVDAVYDAGDS